jgi:hypothetical protein
MFDSNQKGVCFGCRRLGKNKNRDYCARKCKKRKDFLKSLDHLLDQDPGFDGRLPSIYLINPDGRRWYDPSSEREGS